MKSGIQSWKQSWIVPCQSSYFHTNMSSFEVDKKQEVDSVLANAVVILTDETDGAECSICMEGIETAIQLPSCQGHFFHKDCAAQMLLQSPTGKCCICGHFYIESFGHQPGIYKLDRLLPLLMLHLYRRICIRWILPKGCSEWIRRHWCRNNNNPLWLSMWDTNWRDAFAWEEIHRDVSSGVFAGSYQRSRGATSVARIVQA